MHPFQGVDDRVGGGRSTRQKKKPEDPYCAKQANSGINRTFTGVSDGTFRGFAQLREEG